MPGNGGLAAARTLHDAAGRTTVVELTRHQDNAYVRELMAAGTCAYVLKHSGSAELLKAIRSAARNERYVDPTLPPRESSDGGMRQATPPISKREREVLRLTAVGYANKEIAAQLNISVRTVEVHKTHGMRKLQLAGRSDVVRYAALHGWLDNI
jgi:DNA-binding NarL/FixJ family response regulator